MTDGADTIPQKLRIGAFQIVRVVDVRAKKSTKRKKAPGVVVPHRRMLHWEECQPTLARPPLLPDPTPARQIPVHNDASNLQSVRPPVIAFPRLADCLVGGAAGLVLGRS